ncbi:hypothetical protein DS745_07430 [Anaerobacillus alkaliphilus]|uniref:Uncharacterized protein n=1 Tax=Anaerobacillus alkaliphilus TaxID=1548597 RepID=A0A4Q0VVV9_9BACI|nr:hypothetical protein [Anaerobacillus alkaliphilus]RXJ02212.1 hypothetical protein DS745_07430 [Anaerobacillus alkaliphilus]
MPAIASVEELNQAHLRLKGIRNENPDFYEKLQDLFHRANHLNIRPGYICRTITEDDVEKYLPNHLTKPKIQSFNFLIYQLKHQFRLEYKMFYDFLIEHRYVGYENIRKLLFGVPPELVKDGYYL